MKNIIFDYSSNVPLAIASDESDAHSIAEIISYKRHSNAIYGLFQIGLISWRECIDAGHGDKLNKLVSGC